jgi:hypothetical protein
MFAHGTDEDAFPPRCPFTLADVLNTDRYPD